MGRKERRATERASRGKPTLRTTDDDVAVVAGWAHTEGDLPEARKGTHDILIKQLGPRRLSGVEWRQASGAKAQSLLDDLSAGEKSLQTVAHYDDLRDRLQRWGGFLVVAMARGLR